MAPSQEIKEIAPLKEVADVMNWTPDPAFKDPPPQFNVCRSDKYMSGEAWTAAGKNWNWLARNPLTKENKKKPRTLVCHDMMGGYIEDRFTQPVHKDSYSLLHWSGLDIFVYFSHHLLTIPPPGWIKTAKMNGVAVLGTIITEWEEGRGRLETILKDQKTMQRFVDQCGNIAEHHGFQGYLLNIENPIDEVLVPNLIQLVGLLTARMKAISPDYLVIWYDSVTIQGRLEWQDELNALNKPFFDQCDGIFLNYCWKTPENSDPQKDSLLNAVMSLSPAERDSRAADIFVGVDVFGRGCYGGGGFNCAAALEKIRERELSCAIFAPGWTYELPHRENRVRADFLVREHLFWSRLEPFLSFHALKLGLTGELRSKSSLQVSQEGKIISPDTQTHIPKTGTTEENISANKVEDGLFERKACKLAGGGVSCGDLVFRSCFSSGRGEGWFHLSSAQTQPSLPATNNKMCPELDPSIHSQNSPSIPHAPSPIPPSPPPYCCHTTDTKSFELEQSVLVSVEEEGTTVPLFLIQIEPKGLSLGFELLLAPLLPSHPHFIKPEKFSEPSSGSMAEKTSGPMAEKTSGPIAEKSSETCHPMVDLVLATDTGLELILEEACPSPSPLHQLQANGQTWRKAGFLLENCHHTIEKIGLRPRLTSPNFYLGRISIYCGKN